MLAAQFNLPVPVVETAIKDRLGTGLLRAKLRAGGWGEVPWIDAS